MTLLTGGTETDVIDAGVTYRVHKFTADGTLTVVVAGSDVAYLVVGGGAGGGTAGATGGGGGGGAGQMLTGTGLTISANQAITVGGGGAGSTVITVKGTNGNPSSIGALVSSLGGGGGGSSTNRAGATGGSGGGAGATSAAAGSGGAANGTGTTAGGASTQNGTAGAGGAGGGATSAGAGAPSAIVGGAGGAGTASTITGTSVTYAGGGGGASATGGAAGAGGGGAGGTVGIGANGTANTGGGAGGGNNSAGGGNGGSGVVIVRYKIQATPSTVAGTGTAPAPTITATATLTPSAVPATATVGTPSLAVSSTATAVTVSAPATVAAPTTTASGVAAAATVAAPATVPAPTLTAGVTGVPGPGTSRLFVEAAFGGTWKTAAADLTWTDITPYVLYTPGVTTTRGRQRELDRTTTGSFNLTLLNSAGRIFDPTYVDGPHYGDLLPDTPIRVYLVLNTVTYDIEYGYVEDWPQGFSHRDNANTVDLAVYDWYGIAATQRLRSVIEADILTDEPDVLWLLNESSGDVMVDSSGNGRDGQLHNVDFNRDPVVAAMGRAIGIDHTASARGRYNGPLITGYPFTVEMWFRCPEDLTQQHTLFWGGRDATLRQYFQITIPETATGGKGQIEMALVIDGNAIGLSNGTRRVDDGLPHHAVAIFTSDTDWTLKIDGTSDHVNAPGVAAWPDNFTFWSVGNVYASTKGDWGLGGDMNAVAVYPSALTLTQARSHYEAGSTAWAGDTIAERVGKVLDQVGFPAADRDLGETWTRLGAAVLDGEMAGSYLSRLEATEQGRIFPDRAGKMTVHGRYRTGAIETEYADDGTEDSPYRDVKIVQPKALLYGKVTVTTDKGSPVTVEAVGNTSDNTLTIDAPLLQFPAQQRSLAQYVLLRYSTPQTRVIGLSVPVHRDFDAIAPFVLGPDLGGHVQFTRTIRDPAGDPVGDPIVAEQVIEGDTHRFTTKSWDTGLNLSPADVTDWFTIGTSTIEGTDLIAY